MLEEAMLWDIKKNKIRAATQQCLLRIEFYAMQEAQMRLLLLCLEILYRSVSTYYFWVLKMDMESFSLDN